MNKPIQVTFNSDGDHISKQLLVSEKVTIKDNYIFHDTLTYEGWFAGRSSAVITWKGSQGITYQSGMQMLDQVLSGKLKFGSNSDHRIVIKDTFTFKKVGTVVLLCIYKP